MVGSAIVATILAAVPITAPLGIEGYVLREGCKGLKDGVRNVARGCSIAKHIILPLLIGSIIWLSVATVKLKKDAENNNNNGAANPLNDPNLNMPLLLISVTSVAMSVTCLVAIINCLIGIGQCKAE